MRGHRFVMTIRWHERLVTGALVFVGSLTGCLGPIALERAVIQYNDKVQQIEAENLLLNIARTRHHLPLHFETVSSIAASFDFRVNTGLTGAFGPTPGTDPLRVQLSNTVAENPTIFITPVQGEEFTKRLLTPMDETKLEFLLHQGIPAGLIFRLMGDFVLVEADGKRNFFFNSPARPEQYKEFRQRLLHLAWLYETGSLYVYPLEFEEPWPLPIDRSRYGYAREIAAELDNGYRWVVVDEDQPRVLSKRTIGRMMIANYNPFRLPHDERRLLHRKAMLFPRNFVLLDIRPEYPGGDYPLRGWLRLRSFRQVLEFLGRGIAQEPEFDVEKDARTESISVNPRHTLEVMETDRTQPDAAFAVRLNGSIYSIRASSDWDLAGFSVLSQLLQMTVTDVTRVPAPPITIAK
jgi:hypothetical protein